MRVKYDHVTATAIRKIAKIIGIGTLVAL